MTEPRRLVSTGTVSIESAAPHLVHGRHGTTKSWLTQRLAVDAAVEGVVTLYLTGEGDEASTRKRFTKLAKSRARELAELDELYVQQGPVPLGPAALEELREWCRQLRVDLLIIDPLTAYFEGDENSTRDVSRLLAGLTRINLDGVAVVLVHHDGKAGERQTKDCRGSSAIPAWASQVYQLVESRGRRIVHHRKCKDGELNDPAEVRLVVDHDRAHLDVLSAGTLSGVGHTATGKMRAILTESAQTQSDLARAAGLSSASARGALASLMDNGVVERVVMERQDSRGRRRCCEGYRLPGRPSELSARDRDEGSDVGVATLGSGVEGAVSRTPVAPKGAVPPSTAGE